MIDESKLNDEGLGSTDLQDEQSVFNFQNLYAMLVLNWQWFLLSLFICLCGALIYLRYATRTYQVSAKMLIKDDKNNRRGSSEQMLANMQDCSVVTAKYKLGNGMMGTVAIVGPRRMDYKNVVENLRTLKTQMNELFGNGDAQLEGPSSGREVPGSSGQEKK